MLNRLGLPHTEEYLQDLMSQYDRDHNGTIEWGEFFKV
jgi:Ca2+-binding EF-hand superfamily protein